MLLAGGIVAVSALCVSFSYSAHQHEDAAVVNVNQATHEKEYLHLGDAHLFNGASIARMSLYADSSYRGSYSSSSGGNVRNYLFLDLAKMTSRWLFPGFTNLIVECCDFRSPFKRVDNGGEINVVSSVYEVIDSDSNNDRKINMDDQPSVYFASSDGKQTGQIIPPSDHILSMEQLSSTEFLIVYTKKKSTMGSIFSVDTGKKLREAKLVLDDN